jgi:hypothetical protein
MRVCPNVNTKEWKDLVKAIGPFEAMRDFLEYGGTIRTLNEVRTEKPELFTDSIEVDTTEQIVLDEKVEADSKNNFDSQLKEKLFEFANGLGIEIEENADELLQTLEFKKGNTLSAFDTLQKYLALSSNIGKKDLLLQNANIIYTFLGKKSILSIELWKNIKNWSKYQKYYDYYNNSEYDIKDDITEEIEYSRGGFNVFAHRQAIIHFIAEGLEYGIDNDYIGKKRTNPDIDKDYFISKGYKDIYEKNWLLRLFNKIWNFIYEKILNNPVINEYSEQELTNIVLDIVDDVYKKEYTKFIRSYTEGPDGVFRDIKDGTILEQKYYTETLNKDPFAKKVIESLFNHPFVDYRLSGSQVLRKYGRLLRSVDEDLHDIDGVITLQQFLKEKNAKEFYNWLLGRGLYLQKIGKRKQFRKEVTPFLEQQSWYKNLKLLYPSWTLENVFIGRDHKNAESVTITGYIEHPTEMEIVEADANWKAPGRKDAGQLRPKRYILDFFLRTAEGNYPEIFDNYWKDWKQIFEAKLNMGRAKDINDLIYFVPFRKDKYKFTNKGFRYFTFGEPTENGNIEDYGFKRVFQGFNKLDERKINYYTVSEQEAKDYGKNVRSVIIDTNKLLKRNSDEFYSLVNEDYKNTNVIFDILDNSEEGLKKQEQFFNFLISRGYKGIDFTMYSDSQYIVTFDNAEVKLKKDQASDTTTTPTVEGFKDFVSTGAQPEEDWQNIDNTSENPLKC